MRALCLLLTLLLPTTIAYAQVSAPTTIETRDEGTAQGRVRAINCVGAGITCTVSAGVATLTAAGSSGSGNFLEVSVNLGTTGGLIFSATITAQAWVTATSIIVCSPLGTTADGQTIETTFAAAFVIAASNRVIGTGFDLGIFNPNGATGTFRFHCTGA